jgi:hypothetical protein
MQSNILSKTTIKSCNSKQLQDKNMKTGKIEKHCKSTAIVGEQSYFGMLLAGL